jgi:hypothetical protein
MKKEETKNWETMSKEDPRQGINCYDCARFFITYDRQYPYGCRAMGFKSAHRPSSTVSLSSALPCQMFAPKRKRP